MLAINLLRPVRRWIDGIEIHDRELAQQLCKLIPSQCPFERDVKLCGCSLFHVPPLCKLNPLYEQLMGLRFRALCYLVGQHSQEITPTPILPKLQQEASNAYGYVGADRSGVEAAEGAVLEKIQLPSPPS